VYDNNVCSTIPASLQVTLNTDSTFLPTVEPGIHYLPFLQNHFSHRYCTWKMCSSYVAFQQRKWHNSVDERPL